MKLNGLMPTMGKWEGAVPGRSAYSPLTIAMYSLDGPPRLTQLWPYAEPGGAGEGAVAVLRRRGLAGQGRAGLADAGDDLDDRHAARPSRRSSEAADGDTLFARLPDGLRPRPGRGGAASRPRPATTSSGCGCCRRRPRARPDYPIMTDDRLLAETAAAIRDTGIGVADIEIVPAEARDRRARPSRRFFDAGRAARGAQRAGRRRRPGGGAADRDASRRWRGSRPASG